MSVAEFPGSAPSSRPSEFERTPPQDIAAEQCVLGGMMLSKDAIADVVETLRSADFYKPAHQLVYDAVTDLYGRGEPADAVTVAAELTKRGEIGRAGGGPYLHTLISSVPTAANAGYYARIVRERATLRRLVEAGTRITQMGYAADGEVDDIVDAAQAEVYAVTDKRTSEDYLPLSEIMEGALDEIEAIGSRGGAMVGVPTGFSDLDQLTNGFHPGQMIIVAARPAIGKALALDTALPTPDGWTTMGEVRAGDHLLGADGRPTRVVATSEVMHGRPCYRVEFSDGSAVVADADHQWRTHMRVSGSARAVVDRCARPRHERVVEAVRTTEEIAATLRCPTLERRPSHSVLNAEPIDLPERELLLSPYALGVWLADAESASARFTAGDPEIVMFVEAEGLDVVPRGDGVYTMRLPGVAQAGLSALGVLGHKHIPSAYLRSSHRQRRALLEGVLDAAGTVTATGSIQFTTTNGQLADDVCELIVSLGHHCSMSRRRVSGRPARTSTSYTLTFAPSDDVFRLERKRLAHKERAVHTLHRERARVVTAVRRVRSVPVRCVQVDNDSHLYLAGRSMIPTHNSTVALDFARSAAIKHGQTSVIFSLEMGRNEITMRLLSAEARVALHTMRSGTMTDDDWTRLARRMGEVSSAPLFIDDSPNMTMMEIRAKCRRLKQRHDLRLVVVDYLQLMQSGKRVESRQQEVSEFSRSLKLLAKELEVPVIAISQLNRGPEQRTDKKPLLSDLRESGCLTADTRVLRADTGAEVSLGELMATGARDIPVWSVGEDLRLRTATMTHVFQSGTKEVYDLRLCSGKHVKASANHPFLTLDGWRPLAELSPGARIAVPRLVGEPETVTRWPEAEVVMLAHLLGDGCVVSRQPVHYTSTDEANVSAVEDAASHFGVTPRRVRQKNRWHVYLPAPYHLTQGRRNPIAAWLAGFGLYGKRSYEKFLPPEVFGLPRDQVALLLHHLWATDGSVGWDPAAGQAKIYYASTSRRLVFDVALLLLRVDVQSCVKVIRKTGYRDSYHLLIRDVEHERRFLEQVGMHGARGQECVSVLERLRSMTAKGLRDTVPAAVWTRVQAALDARSMSRYQMSAAIGTQSRGNVNSNISPTRSRLARIATVLTDAGLEMLATSDVYWDEVAAIDSLGARPVFDATVLGTHNFVADGIVCHNSLEQDSDMVILLHREDAYERESPRAGEADLIVAKHRNGPTATVTVAFQGHYSRFVDMAHG